MHEKDTFNQQKGIQIDATRKQILSSMLLIIVMLFIPIFGYNYVSSKQQTKEIKVYTYSNIIQQTEQENTNPQVAGVHTKSQNNSNLENQISFLQFLFTSPTFFIVFGVVMIITFTVATFSIIYKLLKA